MALCYNYADQPKLDRKREREQGKLSPAVLVLLSPVSVMGYITPGLGRISATFMRNALAECEHFEDPVDLRDP